MALVLRSRTDLVYLPDHGFVGEEGALRILSQITNKTRRIDVSHNLLGTEGIITLLRGITTLRSRWNSHFFGLGLGTAESGVVGSEEDVWGLKEINLGCNAIGEAGLEAVLGYARKDLFLRKVYLQANDIELTQNLPSLIHSISQTHLTDLSLTTNPLSPSSLITLLQTLSTPHLNHLHLSNCNLGPSLSSHLVRFLQSKRARNLEYLELNGNGLGYRGVKDIVDAVEYGNFTILQLGLFANHHLAPSATVNDDQNDGQPISIPVTALGDQDERILEQDRKILEIESQQLAFQTQKRLPILLLRNRLLTNRVRNAAARVIAPARILLNALPQTDEVIAKRVMESVSAMSSFSDLSSASSSSTLPKPSSSTTAATATTNPRPPFRLLDLPREVIYQIVRHTSQDANALSNSQFTRIIKEAEDRSTITKIGRKMKVRLGRGEDQSREGRRVAIGEVLEGWLKSGGWERWELDRVILGDVGVGDGGNEEERKDT